MNAVNSVHLFILVWTFTAVCQTDDDCSVICEDVTGTVGEEVTFTCSVSQKCTECCIIMYKFQYNDSEICREEFPQGSCEQRNSFTCRYTPTTAMTNQSIFFVQRTCERKVTKFTVDIKEAIKPKTEAPPKEERLKLYTTLSPGLKLGSGSNDSVIAAVVGCLIILIIISITITIIYKTKSNSSTPRGFQKWMFLGRRHDDDNRNFQEQIPQNIINITDSTV